MKWYYTIPLEVASRQWHVFDFDDSLSGVAVKVEWFACYDQAIGRSIARNQFKAIEFSRMLERFRSRCEFELRESQHKVFEVFAIACNRILACDWWVFYCSSTISLRAVLVQQLDHWIRRLTHVERRRSLNICQESVFAHKWLNSLHAIVASSLLRAQMGKESFVRCSFGAHCSRAMSTISCQYKLQFNCRVELLTTTHMNC